MQQKQRADDVNPQHVAGCQRSQALHASDSDVSRLVETESTLTTCACRDVKPRRLGRDVCNLGGWQVKSPGMRKRPNEARNGCSHSNHYIDRPAYDGSRAIFHAGR